MGSPLQQIQIGYDQPQDRLLLSLYGQDWSEYRFWITRRATQAFWDILMQILKTDQKSQLEHQLAEREIAEKIQKESGMQKALTGKFANRVTRRPFGEEPLLLTKISAKPEDGKVHLRLEAGAGQSIEFHGDSALAIALCQLLRQGAQQAAWGLQLAIHL